MMPAGPKLNLYLKATARRPDGYHELVTVFLPLAVPADELALDFDAPPGAVELTVGGADCGELADNLVVRAARLYARRTGLEPAWRFRLEKRIPVAAGLGGGSSDAAAALRLLNERFRKCGPGELAALALELGADVPFFLDPVPSVAAGVGEQLRALPALGGPLHFLLTFPRFPVSARWAYRALAPERIGPDADGTRLPALLAALAAGDPARLAANLHNDLAFALYDKFPLLSQLRRRLLAGGALGAEITGSGPTLFAILPDRAAAAALREALATEYEDALELYVAEAGAQPEP